MHLPKGAQSTSWTYRDLRQRENIHIVGSLCQILLIVFQLREIQEIHMAERPTAHGTKRLIIDSHEHEAGNVKNEEAERKSEWVFECDCLR
jgi:hypothetical protein